MDFKHISVLLNETVESVCINNHGVYVDATLGGAGHFRALAAHLDNDATLIGIDQDSAAIQNAQALTKDLNCKTILVQDNFSNIERILDSLGIDGIDGVVFDLGVSSYQLDTPERGFSYMHDAPLDMRMNQNSKLNAHLIVNSYSQDKLADIIFKYGEERWAKRIAEFIIQARKEQEIKTTYNLVDIIKRAIPKGARLDGPHPAKRTFQAIRIEVNNELGILEDTFEAAVHKLKSGGRIAVITFHSLEDRITKQLFAKLQKGCDCPKHIPVCVCGKKPLLKKVLSIKPSIDEVEENHRSRSARLRVAERI